MIGKAVEKALNTQLNAELYSSYLYLSMSSWFSFQNLDGFANWMRVQAQEELVHAMKFYDYLIQRNGRVLLLAVDAPPTEWDSPDAVFEHTYQHEQKVTGLINELVDLSISEKDHATHMVLQWFVDEQVEEESSAAEILGKIRMLKESKSGIYILDRELNQRVFTPPPAQQPVE
ncbi:MAG: ferritin [Theionarchaea archaeon]|nr:ferritin [Theionarchaea archaeon]MBU7038076.1 ferritin [Theionarchaea archaeon]